MLQITGVPCVSQVLLLRRASGASEAGVVLGGAEAVGCRGEAGEQRVILLAAGMRWECGGSCTGLQGEVEPGRVKLWAVGMR